MNRPLLLALLIGISLLGIADSWYLFQSAVTDTALTCDIGGGLDGCNTVAQSPYSYFIGLPLAFYGVVFFSAFFVLAAVVWLVPKRNLYRALNWLSVVGVGMSAIFLFIQFVLIKAICIYCVASAVLTLLLWILARDLWKRFAPPHLVRVG